MPQSPGHTHDEASSSLLGGQPVKPILLFLIRLYQKAISPLTGPHCRFTPTCSQYAYEAVAVHGAFKGTFLAVCRLLKCHPFHQGGFDPVPAKNKKHDS